jgi:flagellar L-ring protein precursor FlgH
LAGVLVPQAGGAQQGNEATPAYTVPIRRAWTSDRHALQQGDLVTILIDEFILASANKNQLASQERSRDLGVSAGVNGGGGGFDLRTDNDVGDRQRGESSRQQRFSGEISARVVEVSPSGMVRVQGTKKLQIDEVEEEITIRGWVRPQDLSLQNTVESWRMSEAEILYSSNGTLGKTGGFWTRLINKIWP